nr:immunoglobulin light chain junction region [Macaca mulatta]
CMQGVHLPWTF